MSIISEISTILNDYEFAFREEFRRQVDKLKSEKSRKIILAFLEEGRIDLAIEYLEDQNKTWIPFLYDTYLESAKTEAKRQDKEFTFDPTYEETNKNIAEKIASVLLFLNDNQKKLLEYLMSIESLDNKQISKLWQKYFGLTDTQVKRLIDFKNQLKAQQEFDRRAFRDGDQTVTPQTDGDIEIIADGRLNQMLDSRADMDAREAISLIENGARLGAVLQVVDSLGLDESAITKTWRSRRDDRVRFSHDVHGGLDGQTRPLDGVFNSPLGATLRYPHDENAPISETAGCRCFLIYGINKNAIQKQFRTSFICEASTSI